MFEFILYMAFQELDDAEADILQIANESGTPVLDGIELVWESG